MLSLLFLLSFTTFAAKSLEIRPDLPAAALFSAALVLGLRRRSFRSDFLCGLCLGLAFAFSPKVIFGAAGFLASCIWMYRNRPLESHLRTALGLFSGAAVPVISVVLFYLSKHAFSDLYRCIYTFNRIHTGGFATSTIFVSSFKENPILWISSTLGLLIHRKSFLVLPLLGVLLSLVFIPVSYAQNYLFIGPLLSYFSVASSKFLLDKTKRARLWKAALALLLIPAYKVQADSLKMPNTIQIKHILCIASQTQPTDRVFDLWTGYAFFRPHAYYFWCLPPEVFNSFDRGFIETGIMNALKDARCRAVIWDPLYMDLLSEPLRRFIRQHYRDAGCGHLLLRI